jgi:hypothetical protein
MGPNPCYEEPLQSDTHTTHGNHLGVIELVALIVIWGFGFLAIWLLVTNYHSGQKVSLENSITAIVLVMGFVSARVIFRDLISEVVRDRWLHLGPVRRDHVSD